MYLKRFCEDSNQLYAYDKIEKRGYYNTSRAFAHKKFFYDLDPDVLKEILEKYFSFTDYRSAEKLSKIQVVEKLLGEIEGKTNSVLDKLDKDPSALQDDKIKIIVAIFIHSLSVRTIAQRNQIYNAHSQLSDWLKRFDISNNQELVDFCNDTSEEYSKKWQIRRLLSPEIVIEFSNNLIKNYNWYYGVTNSVLRFIISDNPAEMIAFHFNDCCFPISPQKAIIFRAKGDNVKYFTHESYKNDIVNISSRSVYIYNVIQELQAERFLFGDKISIQYLMSVENLFNFRQ